MERDYAGCSLLYFKTFSFICLVFIFGLSHISNYNYFLFVLTEGKTVQPFEWNIAATSGQSAVQTTAGHVLSLRCWKKAEEKAIITEHLRVAAITWLRQNFKECT